MILGQKGLEVIHISGLDTCDDLVVAEEGLLEVRAREDLTVRDVPH
jgi:hypothetical protein